MKTVEDIHSLSPCKIIHTHKKTSPTISLSLSLSIYALCTCIKVSIAHGLQDAVHGSHVEDQTQLSDTHCNQAEQEERAEHTLHEGLSCNQDQQHILIIAITSS